jgi:hypothetical protein
MFWASTSHSYGVLTLFPFCDLITGDGAADEVAAERVRRICTRVPTCVHTSVCEARTHVYTCTCVQA